MFVVIDNFLLHAVPGAGTQGITPRHTPGGNMLYVYILISLVMLIAGIAMLVQIFTKVKEPLMQMFLGVIGVGLILCAVGVFLAGWH
jgi:polyferredoxin